MIFRDSLYFSYAGIKSTEYGIDIVNMNNGTQEEAFAASRTINEVSVIGRDLLYFKNMHKYPLSLSLNFTFVDTWKELKINEVTRWFTEQSYFQETCSTNHILRNKI
ncbi:hypothetical protein [Paenibacillus massiliensis]|uniref:hypothetical protein n=1 Tax=Paenibacillus massiliensis TaxID=225917 RepID=UPI0004211ABE|nr:hypothetical protein [Paenibacillus massiliensis]